MTVSGADRHSVRDALVGAVAWLLAAIAGACGDDLQITPGRLELEQVAVWAMPDSILVSGGLLHGDTALYWSLDGAAGLLRPDRHDELINDHRWEFVGGAWNVDGVQLVANNPPTLLHLPTGEAPPRSVPLAFPDIDDLMVSGAAFSTTWHLHVVDLDTDETTVARASASSYETVAGPFNERISLSTSHGQALVVYPRDHLTWIMEIDATSTRRRTIAVGMHASTNWGSAIGRTVALHLLPLDHGEHLFTMADLGSDRRWLVRMDAQMMVAHVTELDAPVAVLATDTVSRTLLMARDIGHFELALYRWRRVS